MERRRFLGSSGAGLAVVWAATYGPLQAAARALTDKEKEQFLLTAEPLSMKSLKVGTTGTKKAQLSDGRLQHAAHIQTIDVFKHSSRTRSGGLELNFRDSYKFNVAAYRVDRLINLNMVPVSVERKLGGKYASVTWWVDDVLMMEGERFKKKVEPPNRALWNDQMQNARVFNELVYNTDANLGNVLITKDWQVALVDFSRAFRIAKDLRTPKNLTRIDRRVYDGLISLTRQSLNERLSHVLRDSEIEALLARRDKIISHFDKAIASKGKHTVVCSIEGH